MDTTVRSPSKVKHGTRSCLAIGDVFLIKKDNDSGALEKYKAMATLEKSRADEKAQEIAELREMLDSNDGSGSALDELKRTLDDRTGKLREAEDARRASQAAAQAAIEEALQDAASLREQLTNALVDLDAERKRRELGAAQLAEERMSKAAVASGSEAASARVMKLQADLAKAQTELNEEQVRNAAANTLLDQVISKLADEEAARAALKSLAQQEQQKAADIASTNVAEIARLQAEIARLKLEKTASAMAKNETEKAALAKLQGELDEAKAAANAMEAALAKETVAHGATEAARKTAMTELADLRAAESGEDPRTKLLEAKKRLDDLTQVKQIRFDGAGATRTQQSPKGVPQAWSVISLDAAKTKNNTETLDELAAILKDYPELYCEFNGKTDADPRLVEYFNLNSTQAIQDELARNRAVACKEGLVARGVPDEQCVVTWKGCGQESRVDFIPILSGDAVQKLRAEVALLRKKLGEVQGEVLAVPVPVDPRKRAAEAAQRVQNMIEEGAGIKFDGAGAKATQQSPRGVPQAWNIDSLDDDTKSSNTKTLDKLAAILKDYPELYCNLHGSTDADPSKKPDVGLAEHFQLETTQAIQDELARNRATACKAGLEARGVPGKQLVVTWKGCEQKSKVEFTPMLPEDAMADEVAMLKKKLAEALANVVNVDPGKRAAEAAQRVQDLLEVNAIKFDGAGAKATQQSPRGVPQAWNIDSLDDDTKSSNTKTLDKLAAILKDYPELYCNLHGSTDADPSKKPDVGLTEHFQLETTQAIQDELARNRATACKAGLEARGILHI